MMDGEFVGRALVGVVALLAIAALAIALVR